MRLVLLHYIYDRHLKQFRSPSLWWNFFYYLAFFVILVRIFNWFGYFPYISTRYFVITGIGLAVAYLAVLYSSGELKHYEREKLKEAAMKNAAAGQ